MTYCCGSRLHPWDEFAVPTNWMPRDLRCLIIGESPGDETSVYFYDERRRVAVRTIMLRELQRHAIITQPSLVAFKEAGLLFDHAIRCRLPEDLIRREAELAKRYESPRAASVTHLQQPLKDAPLVWVMGRIARNAVAVLQSEFLPDQGNISKPPYPRRVPSAPRFFVSRYLLHAKAKEVAEIFLRFHEFFNADAAIQCVECKKAVFNPAVQLTGVHAALSRGWPEH